MKKETRLTICEGCDGTESSNGDVLIFPDMVRYRRLTHFDVETFVEEVLVQDGEWLPGTPEKLKGSFVFVSSHGCRCGSCGPALVSKLKEERESHELQGKVSVNASCHIGGRKYAGNVVIFGSSIDDAVSGHWYRYVTPEALLVLLEKHIEKGEIVDWLWRGQMGLSEEEQIKSQELRLQLNGERNVAKNTKELTHGKMEQATLECCQQSGKSSSCENRVLPLDSLEAYKNGGKVLPNKKKISKRPPSRPATCGGSAMPTWFKSWEREDTNVALAILCAAVSVAGAYNCYKQLR